MGDIEKRNSFQLVIEIFLHQIYFQPSELYQKVLPYQKISRSQKGKNEFIELFLT